MKPNLKKYLRLWKILKPNLQKNWSLEIFSSPTSTNIEVSKYCQAQPPKIFKYWNILKPNLQARQRRRRSFRRKLTLSWSLWNNLIVIVLVPLKYFERHYLFFLNFLTGLYDFEYPIWAGGPGSALFHLDLCWWKGSHNFKRNIFWKKFHKTVTPPPPWPPVLMIRVMLRPCLSSKATYNQSYKAPLCGVMMYNQGYISSFMNGNSFWKAKYRA